MDTEGNTKVWGTFFVKGETELKDSLDVQGNITLTGDIASGGKASFKGALKADGITSSGDTDPLNTLTLGSTAKDCGGAITVYGLTESASPIFSVDKVGNTIVAGTLAAGDCTVGAIAMSGDLEIGEDGTVFKVTQGDTNSAELTGDFRATGAISATNSITSTTGNITASSGALEGISLNIGSGTAGISSTGQLTCKESLELTVTIPATTEGGTATTLKMIEASSSGVTVRGALNGRTISIIDATDKTETTLSFVDSVLNINTGATIDGMTTTKGITIVDATSEAPTTASISATGALTVKSIKVGDLFELNSDKAEINAELVFKKGVSLSGVSVSGDIDAGDITAKNITASGVIQGKYYISTSDIRKKCEIKSYVSQNSILDLDIKEFEFIGDESHTKHIGCIAQDLQQICPEIVYTDSDGYLAIEENKLVYLLLQEVKELKKEIKKMKGE